MPPLTAASTTPLNIIPSGSTLSEGSARCWSICDLIFWFASSRFSIASSRGPTRNCKRWKYNRLNTVLLLLLLLLLLLFLWCFNRAPEFRRKITRLGMQRAQQSPLTWQELLHRQAAGYSVIHLIVKPEDGSNTTT